MRLSMRWPISVLVMIALGSATPFATRTQAAEPLAARSSDADGVRITAQPKDIAAGSPWTFEIVMDTHSKPLDDDLTKTATLVDDGGRRYAPIAWQGDPPGGHHRKGTLRFAAPTASIRTITLQLRGPGGTPERAFTWSLP